MSAVSKGTAQAHLENLDSIATLYGEIAALRLATLSARATLSQRLYRHLSLFVAENLEHMHLEETANNAALWSLYSEAELLELHSRLLAAVEPQVMMDALRWMASALNPQELAGMVADMQHQAPPDAFRNVLVQVREQLDETRAAKLGAALGVVLEGGRAGALMRARIQRLECGAARVRVA